MKITVVGGGNIGTQFAVHCAQKKHDVCIYTSDPDIFEKHLSIVDETGAVTHQGDIEAATNDPSAAFSERDLIMITYPANMMRLIASQIRPYISHNTIIGVVPGNGGSECAFMDIINNGNTFFLLERVPAIARLVKKGSIVKSTGYRNELHLSALPRSKADECSKIVSEIYDISCKSIPYILNMTMTPSNPVLHTSRLRVLFKDYAPGVTYDRIPLFYEEWNNESSELLLKCDDEVQSICKALPEHHLDYVRSLRDHYESYTAEAMTRKISGIPAFKGIRTPSIEIDHKFIPDLHSRYFTADFSYGLSVIRQISSFAGISTPVIDEISDWYQKIAVEHDEFSYFDYGIITREDFDRFYLF